MINQTADYFEQIGKRLGVDVKIPRPGKEARKICAVTNGLSTALLITAGVALKRYPIALLGLLGIAGAAALVLEKEETDS